MRRNYEPKEKFGKRMRELLDDDSDVNEFFKVAKTLSRKSIRVNKLKIGVDELKDKLVGKGWEIRRLFDDYKEIMIIDSELEPGEIGKTREHLLGYYYVQEITSMMPIIALGLNDKSRFLDLCASPGSKTTQAASVMENKGVIVANDVSIGRISILGANLERCGVTNAIMTRHNGFELCVKLNKLGYKFDKILVDAPCSGEGNIRCSPRTYLEWSENLVRSLGRKQKKIAGKVVEILDERGEMIYSTCTHAPEENEEVVQHLLDNYKLEIVDVNNKLPLKTRQGLLEWRGKKFDDSMKKCVRIYHHDNDMEGFFLCKLRKK